VGAASHYLEAKGIPTTGISLIREHTQQMQLPRFLWVPFELGRPFGAPNEPDFQRRVLSKALDLLESNDGPVVLEDFPEDAPESSDEHPAAWACPIAFHPAPEERPELVTATLDEMGRLAPWHEIYLERRGSAAMSASGLTRERIVYLLGELAGGAVSPQVETEEPMHEWLRLGCDDLRTWYLEAAQGQPGRGSASELRDWFWQDTAAARLIGSAATTLLAHPNQVVTLLAGRALVPREYFPFLMPAADASQ
jgi:hypothetical protein